MSWFSDVNTKLATMKQYCIDQSNSVCAAPDKTNSVARYTAQFNALSSAISGYKTAVESKASQLKDLITFDFINQLTENVIYDPVITKPIDVELTGYDDYWDLFKMNGLVAAILGYANSYFFQGCIISPSGTTANLQTAIASATSAESADAVNRVALISLLQSFTIANNLIILTEQMQISGTFRTKAQAGEIIYTTKHAKEVIDAFTLDVYIPTYIV